MAKPLDLIECTRHGKDQLAVIACVHVLYQGAAVYRATLPRPDEAGEVLCAACCKKTLEPLSDEEQRQMVDMLALVCVGCCREALGERWPFAPSSVN
jgi:hypothetical protein